MKNIWEKLGKINDSEINNNLIINNDVHKSIEKISKKIKIKHEDQAQDEKSFSREIIKDKNK